MCIAAAIVVIPILDAEIIPFFAYTVPNRYKDKNLANWVRFAHTLDTYHNSNQRDLSKPITLTQVHDVRRNKKDLEKAPEQQGQPSKRSRKHVRPSALTPSRIAQLESLNFSWGVRNVPAHVSWDDRFKQLMEYYEAHGSWPPHSLGGLGSWVKHQRRRWAVKDEAFMEKYFDRLEAVGFLWRGEFHMLLPSLFG